MFVLISTSYNQAFLDDHRAQAQYWNFKEDYHYSLSQTYFTIVYGEWKCNGQTFPLRFKKSKILWNWNYFTILNKNVKLLFIYFFTLRLISGVSWTNCEKIKDHWNASE